MTRPIKFRAWDSNEKKMSAPFDLSDREIKYRDDHDIFMADTYDLDCGEFAIMQFTGLLDKNGKEIYEGDIVRRKENDYVIEWGYGGYNERNNEVTRAMSLTETYSIIGNIYENPELLK